MTVKNVYGCGEYPIKASMNKMGRHSEERNRDEESLYSFQVLAGRKGNTGILPPFCPCLLFRVSGGVRMTASPTCADGILTIAVSSQAKL